MSIEILKLVDPELLIPSEVSRDRLEFWLRMIDWSVDRDPRVGPATMRALDDLASSPPVVQGLAPGDFWSLIGRFTSRALPQVSVPREVDRDAVGAAYAPDMGDASNTDRLLVDLEAVGQDHHVALSTARACWRNSESEGSAALAKARVTRLYELPGSAGSQAELAEAWRDAFVHGAATGFGDLALVAEKMFPAVRFSNTAWADIGSLVGDPSTNLHLVLSHLAVLNDHGIEIWEQDLTAAGRQARLGSHGVSASPESPNTRGNRKAIARRDFSFAHKIVRCEWHTKIRPNVNRIHFAVEKGTVFVGTITDHLPV